MCEQMNIFDFIEAPVRPGEWLQESRLGEEMTFDEIAQSVGKVIAIDKSTQSHAWYKAVLVEKILERDEYDGRYRRLIYYDGTKQRGYISEMYFQVEGSAPNHMHGIKQCLSKRYWKEMSMMADTDGLFIMMGRSKEGISVRCIFKLKVQEVTRGHGG